MVLSELHGHVVPKNDIITLSTQTRGGVAGLLNAGVSSPRLSQGPCGWLDHINDRITPLGRVPENSPRVVTSKQLIKVEDFDRFTNDTYKTVYLF